MRRARGNGGRFLNTKKLDGNATQPNTEEDMASGVSAPPQSASSSGSDGMHPGGTLGSLNATQEANGSMMQEMREQHNYANGSGYCQHQSGFPMSAFHPLAGERGEEGNCLGQQRSGMLVGQGTHRTVTIKWTLYPESNGVSSATLIVKVQPSFFVTQFAHKHYYVGVTVVSHMWHCPSEQGPAGSWRRESHHN